MSDYNGDLNEWRIERFKSWVRDLVNEHKCNYHSWDHLIEDDEDEFDFEDWEYIRDNVRIVDVKIMDEGDE